MPYTAQDALNTLLDKLRKTIEENCENSSQNGYGNPLDENKSAMEIAGDLIEKTDISKDLEIVLARLVADVRFTRKHGA